MLSPAQSYSAPHEEHDDDDRVGLAAFHHDGLRTATRRSCRTGSPCGGSAGTRTTGTTYTTARHAAGATSRGAAAGGSRIAA